MYGLFAQVNDILMAIGNKFEYKDIEKIYDIIMEKLSLDLDNNVLYESNKYDPSDSAKIKIVRCFDVSLDYLLGVIDTHIPYFRKERFLILPDGISETDIFLASDFIEFIHNRSIKRTNKLQS